jgi:hypothetical protein
MKKGVNIFLCLVVASVFLMPFSAHQGNSEEEHIEP